MGGNIALVALGDLRRHKPNPFGNRLIPSVRKLHREAVRLVPRVIKLHPNRIKPALELIRLPPVQIELHPG